MALTAKQQLFADVHNGNTTEAAKIAGLSRGYASRLMMDVAKSSTEPSALAVQDAIKARNVDNPKIMTRERRQELWTIWTEGEEKPTSEQLKASELLGKSELDFTEKGVDAATAIVVQIVAPAAIEAPKAIEGVQRTVQAASLPQGDTEFSKVVKGTGEQDHE